MNLRPANSLRRPLVFLVLLFSVLPLWGTTKAKAAKARPTAKTSSHPAKSSKTAQKATRKPTKAKTTGKTRPGIRARIPRTQRVIHVSPAIRETAAARVQRYLADTPSAPFAYPAWLNGFFDALAAEQNDRTSAAAPGSSSRIVRALQFGDSHTAADLFTGELRTRLQAQFGDGGLGFQFPGHPFAGYHIAGSLRSQTSGWTTEGNRFTALGDGDLGLGGISIAASQPGESATLETTCETMQLHFLRQPGGGRLQFTDNGTPISIMETDAGAASEPGGSRAGSLTYACTAGTHAFQFTTLDAAPVKLLGIVTEQPGVTYECIGINGAVAPLMLRWKQDLFAEYLRQRQPDLIVLAYGTNEAGEGPDRIAPYPADFAQVIDNLRRTAPTASILVLGPADRSIASGRGRHLKWHTLPGVDRVATMQKEVCRLHGCAFWDTRRRMGGSGSMPQWVAAGWAQPDRTHLTGTGYHELADALYTDLIRAYNLYQQHTGKAVPAAVPQP